MNAELEFIDTNILYYAHDRTAGERREKAKSLIGRLEEEEKGALSIQVLQEFAVTAKLKAKPAIPLKQLEEIIEDLSDWMVFCPQPYDVIEALKIGERYDIAFWDAMIIHAAKELEATVLWSEDLNAGQNYGGVVVKNPFKEPEALRIP
ncbi:MAG: PIN domain-containing protein [Planctomycetes bacterium]|nr:PIN domain-containing protein [Planctomycetota bacterium]